MRFVKTGNTPFFKSGLIEDVDPVVESFVNSLLGRTVQRWRGLSDRKWPTERKRLVKGKERWFAEAHELKGEEFARARANPKIYSSAAICSSSSAS